MPIPFTCPHCGQLMRVGKRKVGQAVQCIRCHGGVIVPAPLTPSDPTPPSPPDPADGVAAPVWESDRPWAWQSTIVVTRGALYSIGALLVVVAIVSFVLGWSMGRDGSVRQAVVQADSAQAVRGRLTYQSRRGRRYGDTEAVILALPVSHKPDEKLEMDVFRPELPPPSNQHPTIQALRSLGGDFVRADANGDYELEVPGRGAYFILMISNHMRRSDQHPPTSTEIVEIGSYFQRATELLGENDFRWEKRVVRRETTLDHEFTGR